MQITLISLARFAKAAWTKLTSTCCDVDIRTYEAIVFLSIHLELYILIILRVHTLRFMVA